MKKIIVSYNCMEHTITINNNKVSVFNNHFQEHVSPSRFDKYIVSRDFTGTVNSEEILKRQQESAPFRVRVYSLVTVCAGVRAHLSYMIGNNRSLRRPFLYPEWR